MQGSYSIADCKKYLFSTKIIILQIISQKLSHKYCTTLTVVCSGFPKAFTCISKSKVGYFSVGYLLFQPLTCVIVSQQSQHHVANSPPWATISSGSIYVPNNNFIVLVDDMSASETVHKCMYYSCTPCWLCMFSYKLRQRQVNINEGFLLPVNVVKIEY